MVVFCKRETVRLGYFGNSHRRKTILQTQKHIYKMNKSENPDIDPNGVGIFQLFQLSCLPRLLLALFMRSSVHLFSERLAMVSVPNRKSNGDKYACGNTPACVQ
jgi:hypothetical protein